MSITYTKGHETKKANYPKITPYTKLKKLITRKLWCEQIQILAPTITVLCPLIALHMVSFIF